MNKGLTIIPKFNVRKFSVTKRNILNIHTFRCTDTCIRTDLISFLKGFAYGSFREFRINHVALEVNAKKNKAN